MKKQMLIKNKSFKSNDEVAQLLHKIADRIAERKIRFIDGETETEVLLPDSLKFTLKAYQKQFPRKGDSKKLIFHLQWLEGQKKSAPIEIS